MQRLFASALILALALVPTVIEPAFAQDDWGVKRDPFDRKIIARYQSILARDPSDEVALRKLTQMYKRYRTVALLIREYEAKVAKQPKDFSAIVVLGHLHLNQGEADKARELYQRAAQLRPESADVQIALGDLHKRAGEVVDARRAYERALEAKKLSKDKRKQLLRSLADLALDADDLEGARGFYNRYFALDPKDVQARLQLGDALAQHGKHAQAIEVFAQAEAMLRSDPARQVEVITRMGAAHEAAGREDAAIREYRRAMAKVGQSYFMRKELIARIIDIYRRRQALGDLVVEYEKSWPKNRRQHFEWDILARLYEETGDQEKAIEAYEQATRKAPYELDTQRRLIALLENSGREDEALKRYEAVIKVAPGEPRFQLELAERYWRRGQDKQALALLAKMESRFPSDAGVHAAIADLYTRWGKADQALSAYKRLTNIEPNDITHLINLGEQYFQRNQKKQADDVWKRIIAHKTPENYARLGEVYTEHDMLDEALSMYDKAIKLEPKNANHYKGRARAYERKRSDTRAIEHAITDWEKVLELTPTKKVDRPARREARRRVVGLLKRASGRTLRQRMSRWRNDFDKTPPDTEAGYFLVESHLRDHEHDKARAVLQRLLVIDPEDTEAMELLVAAYKRTEDYDKAVALLEKLADTMPSRKREFYNEIAEIKTIQRRDDEAIAWVEKAVQSSPKDPVAYQRLAERYAAMQDFEQAIVAYEKTLELDPRNFRVSFTLAQLYKYVDEPNKAAALYREVLGRATDEELLAKAGREAIALEEMTGTLGGLERTLVPLAFTFGHKPVYRRVLVELYKRYVPQLVDRWRAGDDAALAELHHLGTHGLKPLLEALGDDSDAIQQRIAVDVLGYLGNKGAAAPLVRMAQKANDTQVKKRRFGTLTPTIDWNVRVRALVAAGRLGDARIIDELIELSEHREKTMREAALFALGSTGDARAIAPLVKALQHKNRDSRQTVACIGLAQIPATMKDRAAMASIADVASDMRSPEHGRAACAFALGYLGDQKSAPVLIDILRHGNGEPQRLAAWALGRLGAKSAVPALLQAYFSRHTEVRRTVGWALERAAQGVTATEPIAGLGLVGYTQNEVKYDTRAVMDALPGQASGQASGPPSGQLSGQASGERPSPTLIIGHQADVVAGLESALDRHRDIIVDALEDLNSRDDTIGLGPLTEGLDELPKNQRAQAIRALHDIAKTLSPRLVALAEHRDPKVRGLALSALATIDEPDARRAMMKGMDDAIASVRAAAMAASAKHASLYGPTGPELAQAVAAKLDAKPWQIRSQAAAALGRFGAHADREALRRALSDISAYVRANAAQALGTLQDNDSVDALIEATSDKDQAVAMAAARSLAMIGGARAWARLDVMAHNDALPELSRLARELLEKRKN